MLTSSDGNLKQAPSLSEEKEVASYEMAVVKCGKVTR